MRSGRPLRRPPGQGRGWTGRAGRRRGGRRPRTSVGGGVEGRCEGGCGDRRAVHSEHLGDGLGRWVEGHALAGPGRAVELVVAARPRGSGSPVGSGMGDGSGASDASGSPEGDAATSTAGWLADSATRPPTAETGPYAEASTPAEADATVRRRAASIAPPRARCGGGAAYGRRRRRGSMSPSPFACCPGGDTDDGRGVP